MGGISLFILFALCVAAFIVIALAAALILAIVVSVLVLGVSSTVVAASGAIGTGFIQNKRESGFYFMYGHVFLPLAYPA